MDHLDGTRYVHRGEQFRVGEFDCPPYSPRWRTENWIGEVPHVVFPDTAVRIHQAGREPIVSTANEVILYNGDTSYRRGLVSPDGDHCLFVELGPELADVATPFPCVAVIIPGAMYALQRLVARRVVDPLAAEEYVVSVLAAVIGAVRCDAPRPSRPVRRDGRAVVEAVKEVLATRYAERLSLADIGAAVNYSPYHLARLFRMRTGRSIVGYRNELRARHALQRVVDGGEPLSGIAADTGFASHSHLTTVFGRTFGVRPIDLRGRRSVGAPAQLLTR